MKDLQTQHHVSTAQIGFRQGAGCDPGPPGQAFSHPLPQSSAQPPGSFCGSPQACEDPQHDIFHKSRQEESFWHSLSLSKRVSGACRNFALHRGASTSILRHQNTQSMDCMVIP